MVASFSAGFGVTTRWIARGIGRGWAVVAVLVVIVWLAGRGARAPVGLWLDAIDALSGALAVAVGAWGARVLTRERGAGPLAAAGVAPGGWFAGQAVATALVLGLACGALGVVGAIVHGGGFQQVLAEPSLGFEGRSAVVRGERWAVGRDGALCWRIEPVDGAATFATRLRVSFMRVPGSILVPLDVRVGAVSSTHQVSPGGAIEVAVSPSSQPRDVTVRAGRNDVILRPEPHATHVVRDAAQVGASVWWRPAFVAWIRAMWLAVVAQALALVVIPPIAVLGALSAWLVGTVAPFLADYAEHAGNPSIFSVRAGDSATGATVAVWLSNATAWMPNLRGGRVADALAGGWAPPIAAVVRDVGTAAVASIVVLVAAAFAAMRLWRREAGRIPGRGAAR